MVKRTQPLGRFAVTLVATCVLSACGTTPFHTPYQRPTLDLPASLPAPSGTAQVDLLQWWQGFQDPALDALLTEATRYNQDLALATARVAEARATLDQNHANFFPAVDLNASGARRRNSENSGNYNANAGVFSKDSQVSLSASYEIDFWGRYARADDAARARLLAQSASRGTVLSTLYANVAQGYFALRSLDAQTALAELTLTTRQESLRLQQRRFDSGVVGELDLRQAQAEAAGAQATLTAARQNRSNTEAALTVLLGRQPSAIAQPVVQRGAPLEALYAAQLVPANLPSDVMSQRPDVVAAEQALIAANADIGQARAAYFPRLSLTAAVGNQSKELSTLFDPASLFWNVVGNLAQPVFRAGAIGALVSAANAREQQALAQYTQTVQNAFKDVHDALNNVAATRSITSSTLVRIGALQTASRLADLRYKAGYSGYLEVLNAQRDLAQAQSGLIDTQRSHLAAVVSLYKALGGGWSAQTADKVTMQP